jgi:hypothetical protein
VEVRAPTAVRVGAAAVALAALALVLPAPAAAEPLSTGVGLRPRTVIAVQERLAELGFLPAAAVDGLSTGGRRRP